MTDPCPFCGLIVAEYCVSKEAAAECENLRSLIRPLRIVGQESPEAAAAKLHTLKILIAKGAAWELEPWLAMLAEDHIKRGLCDPPVSKLAMKRRDLWSAKRQWAEQWQPPEDWPPKAQ